MNKKHQVMTTRQLSQWLTKFNGDLKKYFEIEKGEKIKDILEVLITPEYDEVQIFYNEVV